MSETSDNSEPAKTDEPKDPTEGEKSGAEAENEAPESGSSKREPSGDAEKSSAEKSSAEKSGSGDDGGADDVAVAHAAPEGPRPSYVFLAGVTLVTLAADLGTKIWAEGRFENARGAARQMEIIKEILLFRLARNKGGAWGILGGESPALRISFFVAISIVAVAFILALYRKTTRAQRALTWGLPLVLGGALGNLVDRIRYGEVIDFIEVHLGSYQHPTFNIADIAIVVGVGLMAIDMFTPRRRPEAEAPAPTKPAKA